MKTPVKRYSKLESAELKKILATTAKYSKERTASMEAFAKSHNRTLAGVTFKLMSLGRKWGNKRSYVKKAPRWGNNTPSHSNNAQSNNVIKLKIKGFRIDGDSLIINY